MIIVKGTNYICLKNGISAQKLLSLEVIKKHLIKANLKTAFYNLNRMNSIEDWF